MIGMTVFILIEILDIETIGFVGEHGICKTVQPCFCYLQQTGGKLRKRTTVRNRSSRSGRGRFLTDHFWKLQASSRIKFADMLRDKNDLLKSATAGNQNNQTFSPERSCGNLLQKYQFFKPISKKTFQFVKIILYTEKTAPRLRSGLLFV